MQEKPSEKVSPDRLLEHICATRECNKTEARKSAIRVLAAIHMLGGPMPIVSVYSTKEEGFIQVVIA